MAPYSSFACDVLGSSRVNTRVRSEGRAHEFDNKPDLTIVRHRAQAPTNPDSVNEVFTAIVARGALPPDAFDVSGPDIGKGLSVAFSGSSRRVLGRLTFACIGRSLR